MFLFVLISCHKEKGKHEQPIILQENNEQNAFNNINIEDRATTNERIQIKLETEPQGAYVFFEEGHFFITPVILNLQQKDYKLKIERLRYYPEELTVDVNQIIADGIDLIQVQLRRNALFTEDYYLSDSIYLQADGIGREFRRYIYNENAQLIRIDRYTNYSYEGYYSITLDNNGNIITEQFYNTSNETTGVIKHFEYNNENLLIRTWYSGRDDLVFNSEYIYQNGVLERQVSQNKNETFVYNYIVEIENGSINSEFTKRVIEKYFHPNYTDKERIEALVNDYLPRTIYTYQ
jgi:hypothetical protein